MNRSYDEIWHIRVDLAAAHRIAVLEGLHEGTWTQYSTKVPGRGGHLLVTPGDTHFGMVTASSLLMLDPTGAVVEGDGAPNMSTWGIHHPLHTRRPDIGAVLHAHSPYCTSLTMLEDTPFDELASQSAASYFGKVAYCREFDGMVSLVEQGERMADALGDKRVLFLENHGVIVVAPSVDIAIIDLINLEHAAMWQLIAMSSGRPLRRVSETAARSVAKYEAGGEPGSFGAYKRYLASLGQQYAV